MNIDNLTIKEAREIAAMFNNETPAAAAASTSVWASGENYLIRTVTVYLTGKLVGVTDKELVLSDAAYIGNTGPFAAAVESGNFKEVEPFPAGRLVIVGRAAIIDAVTIDKLPRERKS